MRIEPKKSYAAIPLSIYSKDKVYIELIDLGALLDAYDTVAAEVMCDQRKALIAQLDKSNLNKNAPQFPTGRSQI